MALRLKKQGFIMRLAYWGDYWRGEHGVPTLCGVFWRCILHAALILAACTAIGIYIAACIVYPMDALLPLLFFIAILAIALAVAAFTDWVKQGSAADLIDSVAETPIASIVVEGIRGIKNRYCPTIDVI